MKVTPFNTESFRSEVGRPAPASKYLVDFINAPDVLTKAGLAGAGQASTNQFMGIRAAFLSLTAVQAELPMRQFDTIERRYNGPVRQIPIGHTYSTMNLEFVEDANHRVRSFFAKWQENSFSEINSYQVPFYSSIVIPEVQIRIYGQDGREMERYVVYEVFPINIGSTQLSWANKDQVMTTNVEFSFHRWENVAIEVAPEDSTPNKHDRSKPTMGRPAKDSEENIYRKPARFQDFIDRIRDVNNAIKFVKGSFKTAQALGQQIRSLKDMKIKNFDDFTKAAGRVGETVRRTTDSTNSFGTQAQQTVKRFTTEQVNKFFG